ncbi:thioredoxin family protein [Lacticaseibacillus hulanensis]|uniref:thioredoxin family protein n=1 Tax=Lacticaseibacillus hulanensis TaxID=2493111 RepID=UPI000FD8859A|nr:thioredoxin family protein [Lacticaseibacillus hulanensis]
MPRKVTADNLEELTKSGTVVMDIWAPWCGPCKILSPMLVELEKELPGLHVITQNVDDDKSIAAKFGVQSVPTMVIFQNGRAVEKVTGAFPKAKLRKYLEGVLAREA